MGFKVLGATVAAGPAINAVMANTGNPQAIPGQVLFNYTGISTTGGSYSWNQTAIGIGSIAGGIIIAKLGGILGRMLR